MPTYKDQKTGRWYCKFVYEDWSGKKKQKRKWDFDYKRRQKNMKLIL